MYGYYLLQISLSRVSKRNKSIYTCSREKLLSQVDDHQREKIRPWDLLMDKRHLGELSFKMYGQIGRNLINIYNVY